MAIGFPHLNGQMTKKNLYCTSIHVSTIFYGDKGPRKELPCCARHNAYKYSNNIGYQWPWYILNDWKKEGKIYAVHVFYIGLYMVGI